MELNFATRTKSMKASEIRELLKLAENPNIISFSGGFPAPEFFPTEELKKITNLVLDKYSSVSLQYGASEGYTPLRQVIAKERMSKVNVDCSGDNILITSGSQQGLDFTAKIFINKGDKIVVERPTYLGAVTAFKAYEPEFVEVDTEEDGMNVVQLEEVLKNNKDIKFIYTIPDFQNPSGITMSLKKRKQLCILSEKYKVIILEDSPYGELIYEGKCLPSIKSFDKAGYVIYLGTFSKIFCPGLRIGWICADEAILNKFLLCKQGADLQVSTFNQLITYEYLNNYDIDSHIEKLRNVYKSRKENMIECTKKYFPSNIKYTTPIGGLFIWLELPEHLNSREIFKVALENGIAFVPGDPFYALGGDFRHLRLNYSCMDEAKAEKGMKKLGEVLKRF